MAMITLYLRNLHSRNVVDATNRSIVTYTDVGRPIITPPLW